jgi:predicted lipoprotein with Yx(FWY)xxD motif
MSRTRALVPLLVMALLVAACGKSSKKASTATTAAPTATTAAAGASTTVAEQPSGTTLSVADNASLGKKIIVDAAGKTVYLYVPDGASKTSTVPANIKANWPAVRPPGGPQTVSPELNSTNLQTDMQADGSSQLAYNGHLLYHFTGDAAAGDAKGNGLGSVWYALGPDGERVG